MAAPSSISSANGSCSHDAHRPGPVPSRNVGQNQVRLTQPSVKHQQVGHEEGEPSCTPSPLTFCSTPRGRSTPPRGATSTDAPSGLGGGTPVACVGISVDIHVGSSVVVNRRGHGWPDRGPVGLRSLPAKQHAPKARLTDHGQWPAAGGGPGQARSRHAARMTSRHRCPTCTASLGAIHVPVRRGGESHAWSRQAANRSPGLSGCGVAVDSSSCYCGG
jgi:hypothetical protein